MRFLRGLGRFFWRFMIIFSFIVNLILVLVLVEVFDATGTMIGVAKRARLIEEGKPNRLGRALLAELMAAFERAGARKVMAVIGDSGNAGSIGVHKALGFEHVGVVQSCGWKFDRWLDIVLMQKSLGPGDTTPPTDAESRQ